MAGRLEGGLVNRHAGGTHPHAKPPMWEIEWHVVDVACQQLDGDRDSLTPDSRLFEDLDLDSLDAVHFIMELEERFDVTLSEADCQECFVDRCVGHASDLP